MKFKFSILKARYVPSTDEKNFFSVFPLFAPTRRTCELLTSSQRDGFSLCKETLNLAAPIRT